MLYNEKSGGDIHSVSNKCKISYRQNMLSEDMRQAWLEHVIWTRLLILALVNNTGDAGAATHRLLENPGDFKTLYRPFYGPVVAQKIDDIIKQHLELGKQLIVATIDGDISGKTKYDKLWYKNADEWARLFASINPFYDEDEIRTMLYMHLEQTKSELTLRINKYWIEDVTNYDQITNMSLDMADAFTKGIVRQFGDKL